MENKKNIKGAVIIIIVSAIIGALIMLIVGLIINTNSNSNSKPVESNQNVKEKQENSSNESKKTETKELTESQKMTTKIVSLMNEKLAFDTGNYIQGDIPAGEYAFVKFNGSGSYYCEKDSAGNIVDNENFDSFGYVKVHSVGNLETRGVLVNISAFEKLGVSGAKQIYEILNDQKDWNQSGYYKVGVDIPQGSYVVESIGSGYYAIMTGPVSDSEIVDNDNFNGRSSINITNGQYLNLHRAKISQ